MKKDYTLLIFNNSILVSVDSPSYCLFNSDLFSLKGKPIEYFFISDSIDSLLRLENGRKTSVNLCAKTSGAIFSAFAVKIKFQKTELIVIYSKENMSMTNTDTIPYTKHSVLEELMLNQNQEIFRMLDELKTTRNIQQLKKLKETFSAYYNQMEECVLQLIKTDAKEKYQFESFHLSLALKNYLATIEAEYPNKIWISYRNFLSAHVLGNREQLLALLDHFFLPYLREDHTKVIVSLIQENDTAIAEFTVLNQADVNAEFSEELTDFSKNETTLLAKKAGCTVKQYDLPDVGTKLVISYDALTGYHLYENQD